MKPGNICIDNSLNTRIIDFGLARSVFSNEVSQAQDSLYREITNAPTEYVQTRSYRAPELVFNHADKYGYSIDIWSVGLILIEMMTGQPVLNCPNPTVHISQLLNILGKIPYFDELNENIKSFFQDAEISAAANTSNFPSQQGQIGQPGQGPVNILHVAQNGISQMPQLLNEEYERYTSHEKMRSRDADQEAVKNGFFEVIYSMVTMDTTRPMATQIIQMPWYRSLVPAGYNHETDDISSDNIREEEIIASGEDVSYYKDKIRAYFNTEEEEDEDE